ncbi:ABC transporter ATP-binding protein [Rapidithrix thailandica]|uniref:ABC transporter ATP-binding protein n=1 Tax=Rapidithrix thailandica TaxID=413964 RepID=A0AAW9S132_9BACT
MATILEVNQLRKSFFTPMGELVVLQDITFSVQEGESLAIVGASGSGKSTLLGLCAGLDRVSGGTVSLTGLNLASLSEDERALLRRKQMGFVFQSFQLMPTLTALENVELVVNMNHHRKESQLSRHILQKLGLGHRLHHYPGQLSGGEQQRVAIARAFVLQPKIIFADEPTGNLDALTGCNIINQLFDLNSEHGTTLIVVTHDEALAARAKKVYRLD